MKPLKIISKICIVFLLLYILYEWTTFDDVSKKVSITLCIIITIMIPYILDRFKIYHMSMNFKICFYIFVILSTVLGSYGKFYYRIWWYDLLVHFYSGFLSSSFAVLLLLKQKMVSRKQLVWNIIYILVIVLSVASLWELFEFAGDKIFITDSQWVNHTGINDTMTDILIAFLAGILFSIYYIYQINKDEKHFIIKWNNYF